MYKISQLASKSGLARSTLLYYEKLGLLQGQRKANGYRFYTNTDLQRLELIKQLQAGGLSLKECLNCLNHGLDQIILTQRLQQLDEEIADKQQARQLLASLLGEDDKTLRSFHTHLEQKAPIAHGEWLQAQGFNEKDTLQLRWISRNLYRHKDYMKDFLRIFAGLERHGPGTEQDSLWALSQVQPAPASILDIGSGTGASALLLAQNTSAQVTALDNLQESLDFLNVRAARQNLSSRVHTCCASMTEMPFAPNTFDLLWSEGSAYIMGFEKALKSWQPFINDNGYLVISDLVWTGDQSNDDITEFWQTEYPDMQTTEQRLQQCQKHGYKLIDSKMMGRDAWEAYTVPLMARLQELEPEMPGSQAIADLKKESGVLDRFEGRFTYMIMVLQKDTKAQ